MFSRGIWKQSVVVASFVMLGLVGTACEVGSERDQSSGDTSSGDSWTPDDCDAPFEGTVGVDQEQSNALGIEDFAYTFGDREITAKALNGNGEVIGTFRGKVGMPTSISENFADNLQNPAKVPLDLSFTMSDGSEVTADADVMTGRPSSDEENYGWRNRVQIHVGDREFWTVSKGRSDEGVASASMLTPLESSSVDTSSTEVVYGPNGETQFAKMTIVKKGEVVAGEKLEDHPVREHWNRTLEDHQALRGLLLAAGDSSFRSRLRRHMTLCTNGHDSSRSSSEQNLGPHKQIAQGLSAECVSAGIGCLGAGAVAGGSCLGTTSPVGPAAAAVCIGSASLVGPACGAAACYCTSCGEPSKPGDIAEDKGDPHLSTADGLAYDFQAAGEFVFAESTADDNFEVQVRQEPDPSFQCRNVTYVTAVAIRTGEKRIGYYPDREHPIWIDGEPTEVAKIPLSFAEEGEVFVTKGESTLFDPYRVRAKTGETIYLNTWSLSVNVPDSREGKLRGLVGHYDGKTAGDLSVRDGEVLSTPLQWDKLYGPFSSSWRISSANSLFDYESGNTTETFTDETIPSKPALEELSQTAIDEARTKCKEGGVPEGRLLKDCILDVACTGDSRFVDLHADRPEPEKSATVETGGGGSTGGPLLVKLEWSEYTDIDLQLKTPPDSSGSRQTLTYGNTGPSGGTIDDSNGCIAHRCNKADSPYQELAVWDESGDEPLAGEYDVMLYYPGNQPADPPNAASYTVKAYKAYTLSEAEQKGPFWQTSGTIGPFSSGTTKTVDTFTH